MTKLLVAMLGSLLSVMFCAGIASAQSATQPATHAATESSKSKPTVLTSADLANSAGLTIGQSATYVLDLTASNGSAKLDGPLTNAGTIYAVSTNPSITSLHIDVVNLTNQVSGLITTILPPGGLPGFTSLVSGVGLEISAAQLLNHGTISSAGNLAINTSTSFTNTGYIASVFNLSINTAGLMTNTGVIEAARNINLQSAIGNIINSGQIVSSFGNINVSALASQSVTFNNLGGVLSALNGTINFRDVLYSGSSVLNITGGDFLTRQLNLFGGQGDVAATFGAVEGIVNAVGNNIHMGVVSNTLQLGSIHANGDPTFFNDTSDITITGDIFVSDNLAILAAGNINVTAGIAPTIQARGGGQGFNIVLSAGSKVTGSGATTAVPPLSGAATSFVALDPAATGLGGNIDFSAATGLTINANSTCAGCSGGNITLAANTGTNGGGQVLLPSNSSIQAGGNGNGNNGNVSIIAGNAAGGTSITLGAISTNSGFGMASNTGVITIATAKPQSSGALLIFDTTGAIINGTHLQPGVGATGSVNLSGNLNASNRISVTADSGIIAPPLLSGTLNSTAVAQGQFALAPNGFLYVPDTLADRLIVLNPVTNTVVASALVGAAPVVVVASATGSRAYVVNSNSDTVSVIDTISNTVVGAPIPVGSNPAGAAFDSSGRHLFVTNSGDGTVSVIDTATNVVVATTTVGTTPLGIATNNSNGLVFVINFGSQNVSIIDPGTFGVVNTVGINFSGSNFGPCPCGTKEFVNDFLGGQVYAFSAETNSIIPAPVTVGNLPTNIAINPTGSTAYISNSGSANVSVLTTLTNTLIQTIALPGSTPGGSVATFVGDNPVAYVADRNSGNIFVLQSASLGAPAISLKTNSGEINVAVGSSTVSATSNTGSVIITSARDVVSAGGSGGKSYQIATTANTIVSAPVTAPIIDFHAISGTFTNNSLMTATGPLLFIASSHLINTGIISNTSALGQLGVQAPDGNLVINNGFGASISADVAAVKFNPAGGFSINASGSGNVVGDTVTAFGTGRYMVSLVQNAIAGGFTTAGNPGAVSVATFAGPLNVRCCIDTSSTSVSGGSITLAANGGALSVSGILTANGSGAGFSGGNITLSAQSNLLASGLSANGGSGASGGNVTLHSNTGIAGAQNPAGLAISAIGTGAGNGGTVVINGSTVGVRAPGTAIDVSAGGTGRGGAVTVTSNSGQLLNIGSLICNCNIVSGDINANGFQGGNIVVVNFGDVVIQPSTNVQANGTFGGGRVDLRSSGTISVSASSNVLTNGNVTGGLIQISAPVPGAGAVSLINNGLIQAQDNNLNPTTGIVGINADVGPINVSGTGTLFGGASVNFGALDPVSLKPFLPRQIPATSLFFFGRFNVAQGATILNQIFVGSFLQGPSASEPLTVTAPATAALRLPALVLPGSDSSTILPTDEQQKLSKLREGRLSQQKEVIAQSLDNVDYIDGVRISLLDAPTLAKLNGSAILIGPNSVELNSGHVLLTPLEDTIVSTPFATLHLSAGSVVFTMVLEDALVVFNIHDNKAGDVWLDVEQHKMCVPLGNEALITQDETAEFGGLNPACKIAVRSLGKRKFGSGKTVFGAEFSLPMALSLIGPLRELRASDSIDDQSVYRELLRNAAIISLITSRSAAYRSASR